MKRYFDDVLELLEGPVQLRPLGHVISDEAHREIWSIEIPGRSTEEKLDWLIGWYSTAYKISKERLLDTPPLIMKDDLVQVESFTIDVRCRDCHQEGIADAALCPDGLYMNTHCPDQECGSRRLKVLSDLIRRYEGL